MEPILHTDNLTIRFGGHTAVDGVNFQMPEKHLKSIIGPNGAGKTTFFNLISGELKPTAGDVYFKGQSLAQKSAIERTRMGLGRSFQITNVFPNLTVLENVRLAVQSKEKIRYQLFRHYKSYKAITEKADSIMVLFNGQLLADGSPEEIMDNDTVQHAYLGGLYDEHLTDTK